MHSQEKTEKILVSIGEIHGSAGFRPFRSLVTRLAEKYPNRMYANLKGVERRGFSESYLTRVASVNGTIAGVLSGESVAGAFKGEYLFVDPQYSSHAVGEKLIRSIFSDHTEFVLDPVPLSYLPGFDVEGPLGHREKALQRYYRRLGFEHIPHSRRMRWSKSAV